MKLGYYFNILFAEKLLLRTVGVSMVVTEIRHPVAAVWEQYKFSHRPENAGKKLEWSRGALSCCVISCKLHHHQESRRLRSAFLHKRAAFSPESETEQD